MATGYLCVLQNPSMPNLLKICITEQMPEDKLKEENKVCNIPTFYRIILCKNVKNTNKKLKILYKLIDNYRVNKRKDFFRIDIEKIKLFFELIDGDYYKIDKKIYEKIT